MNDMSGTDLIERAFSPSGFLGFHAWGDAPGWDICGPLALSEPGEFANVGVLLWAPQSRFLGFRASQKYSRLSHREWQALLVLPNPCEFAPTPLTAAMSGAAKALTAMAG